MGMVGVLTAALHGASHQQPQEYQVVVATPERAIRMANLNIRFFLKKSMRQAPVERVKGGWAGCWKGRNDANSRRDWRSGWRTAN